MSMEGIFNITRVFRNDIVALLKYVKSIGAFKDLFVITYLDLRLKVHVSMIKYSFTVIQLVAGHASDNISVICLFMWAYSVFVMTTDFIFARLTLSGGSPTGSHTRHG